MPELPIKKTPEEKADEAMAQFRDTLLTYVAGPDGWPLSGLQKSYPSYGAWEVEVRSKNPAIRSVMEARAMHPDAIREALIAYYRSLEPPPEAEKPKIPWEVESPGIPAPGQPLWADRLFEQLNRIEQAVMRLQKE